MFKLYSDIGSDTPIFVCEVCQQRIDDPFAGKATSTPSKDGKVCEVTIHHSTCAALGKVSMVLANFVKLISKQYRIGDLGSNGKVEKLTFEMPEGMRFQA